jgi:cytoskeleton protein RodZ
MFSVGETLKRARVAQGVDLCTLAARTKINVKYLEAIESDDRSSLPSSFFYRSFVDQYASALSLDTREIDAAVDRVLSADAPLPLPGYESVVARNVAPLTYAPRFHSRRTYASLATLVLVVVACSGVYTAWRKWRTDFSVHAAIDHMRSLARTNSTQASSVKPAAIEKPAPAVVRAEARLESTTPESATDPAPPGYKVMLNLMAHEATWLSVSSDGKPVFSGILQANESKSVGGKQFAKMRVGNAAGLEVRLNGKLLGPLGARGQVLVVLFTPDNFEIVAQPRESD